LAAQAGSLRGRDLSQIIGPFKEENVFAAGFGERVGDATPDSATADNDKLRSARQS
jgi:hypothetical protein